MRCTLWIALLIHRALADDAAYSAATVERFRGDPACAVVAGDPSPSRCCPSYALAASDVRGGVANFDALWIEAIPKAAWTTVREALVPALAPLAKVATPRAEDRLAGSEVCPARNATAAARFVLVRDPLARALSAFHELRRTRLGHWDRSRGRRHLPSLTASRDDFSNESQVLAAFFADLGNGVLDFDAHTWPQSRCVAPSAASAAASVVGRLHRADAAWRVFQSIAGVAVEFPEARRNERHRGAADHRRRRAPTASLLDGAMWDAFCRHYRRDYRCLGFDPPPACASRWGGPA